MAQITKAVNVDVAMENLPLRVVAKQNDIDSRFLKATIRNEGVKIDVPSDAAVKINVMRADKKSGAFVGTVNSDGTVTVPLTDWVLGCAGIARCSISIIGPDEQKLTSTAFVLDVDAAECPGADVTESGNYEARVAALDALFKIAVYKEDASAAYSAFRTAFGLDEVPDAGGDSGGSGDNESGGGETTPETGAWLDGKFYFELSQGKIQSTASIGYIQSSFSNRASYVGLSCTLTPGNSYRLVGLDDVQYGVHTITESGYAKILSGSNLLEQEAGNDSADKLDSGWKSSGYEFVADDAAVCAWVTAHYSNNAAITPEQAMPVYLEEVT